VQHVVGRSAGLLGIVALVLTPSPASAQAPATPLSPQWTANFWTRWQSFAPAAAREATEASLEQGQIRSGAVQSAWPTIDHDLYLAATRPVPAGLSATRKAERIAERKAASDSLAAALDGSDGQEWRSFLEERLRYFQDEPRQWIALADLVVELRHYELAPSLAVGLEAGQPVRSVAQDSLAQMYGKEFASHADFVAFTEGLTHDAATLRLIDELCAERARARENRIALFAYDTQLAEGALSASDRLLRLGAARALAEELRNGGTRIDELAPALLARIPQEDAPEVAAVMISTLADTIEGRPTGGPVVEGLRAELAERAVVDASGLRLVLARALAQLPWPGADAEADDAIERGAELIAGLIATSALEQDPDVTLGVLQSLNSLCVAASVTPAALERLQRTDLKEPLLDIAFDQGEELSARVVAVGILPRVAAPAGLQDLIRLVALEEHLVSEPELPTSLRFAVLGALGTFAGRADLTDADLAPLVTCLIQHAERPEADLRNLALELLGDGALAGFLEELSVQPFIDRMGVESDADVLAKLIALVRKYGTAEDLPRVLALAGFDALAARDLPPNASLAGLIQALAGADGALTFAGAERLWAVDAELGLWARREAALALLAGLETETAAGLAPEQHRELAVWAHDLRGAGVDLAGAMPGGADFLERLVDVHLVGSSTGPGFGLGEQNFWSALFLSDLSAAREGMDRAAKEALRSNVLTKYARAEEQSKGHADPGFLHAVRRSRARFLVAEQPKLELAEEGGLANGLGTALADFASVFDSEHEQLLDVGDLRSAGNMAAKLDTAPDLERAVTFGLSLISRPSWRQEPQAVRVADLEALATRALTRGEAQQLRAVQGAFAGLPLEMGLESTVDWDGMVLERDVWARLRGKSSSLDERVAQLPSSASPDVAALPEGGDADSALGAGAEGPNGEEAPASAPDEQAQGADEGGAAQTDPAQSAEEEIDAVPVQAPDATPPNTPDNEPVVGATPEGEGGPEQGGQEPADGSTSGDDAPLDGESGDGPPEDPDAGTPDKSPSETPGDKPSETPAETPVETPTETPVEAPDETPQDSPEGSGDETPEDEQGGGDTPDETPEPEEAPEEAPEEGPGDAPEDTPEETPVPKDSPDEESSGTGGGDPTLRSSILFHAPRG